MAKKKTSKSKARQESAQPQNNLLNNQNIQLKGQSRLFGVRCIPRTVAHGLETLEAYSMRQVNADNIRRNAEHAKHERFRASCEKFRQFLAYATVRAYWLDQAEPIIKTEKNWQGPGGASFNYEWPRDKAKIYAIVLLALDHCSSIKIIPENLRQTEFCKANQNIGFSIENFDLAPEYLANIEADLKEQGLLDAEKKTSDSKISGGSAASKEDSRSDSGKKRRKSKAEKIGIIAAYYNENPGAKSPEIENATGIDASDVRHLWKPIKQKLQEGKRAKPESDKKTGEPIDRSASCNICQVPLSDSFGCNICKKIIIGECKTCHFTNTHSEDAFP